MVAFASAGGNVYALAGNHSGLIQATGTTVVNGQVWLTAAPQGEILVSGSAKAVAVDASGQSQLQTGGQVSVSGECVVLSDTATIDASGYAGTGWCSWSALCMAPALLATPSGFTEATGAKILANAVEQGNGSMIETVGHVIDVTSIDVNAAAANGVAGTWLLNPWSLTTNELASPTVVGESDIHAAAESTSSAILLSRRCRY